MRPRVLHLIGSFHQGGSERQALQLARMMREGGRCRVDVACLDRRGSLLAEAEGAGFGEIAEYRLTSFYDANFVAQLRRFVRHLRAREIEVVQSHDFYTNIFGMLGAAAARVPARVAARRETDGFRSAAQRRAERAAYRLAHAVVANAEAIAARLAAEGVPRGKVVTVHNGLDAGRVAPPPGRTREEARAAFGLPHGRPLVTIVANLRHPVKDHPTFLRAARRVAAAVPDAAFAVAGEGELTGAMRELAEGLGVGPQTFFTGRCDDVGGLLYASDVCVLSSRAEGFSNSILEYMAAGRPVVATDVGGAREAVVEGETGFLVPPGDDGRLAERVSRLLKNPAEARALGEAGRRRVLQQFSCEAQLAQTHGLYERLLKGARAPRGRGAERAYGGGA
ncbi:MAG TPA: glycosyltransferase [Pyrinomonadaceae bacterium]